MTAGITWGTALVDRARASNKHRDYGAASIDAARDKFPHRGPCSTASGFEAHLAQDALKPVVVTEKVILR